MIFVPLPFVVSVLLVTILAQSLRRGDAPRLFLLLIAAYAVQSVLIGLRWGYDLREVRPLMALLATLIAPLAWLSFRSLAEEGRTTTLRRFWPHCLPAIAVVGLMLAWPDPVGLLIIAVFLFYGVALLWLARLGPDGLVASRLDGALRSHRALQVTGLALLGSAIIDILVSADLAWNGGAHSGAVISVANVLALLVLGYAASIAGASSVAEEPTGRSAPIEPDSRPTPEDRAVAAAIEALMRDSEAFRDTELNLGRIARRLKLPARDVSRAVNRSFGMSVSQYVNDYRVKSACQLLAEADEPVTKIMFDAGFLTKSNFNREFLRVTGLNPTAWRQQHRERGTGSVSGTAGPAQLRPVSR
ncbi:helix-turn-helix domain-containing protein [Aurantimonas aggregata]|uniref:Helix-turn-helix domain-containing protein n=1 Tax=Aurantimonas aggregata TaxID=2047720 RepID=A0A6L9MIT6_9HYPH|nr:AraC family transcriptional regulator [Aurantimonas aggregata]NDV87717.1 helix-turn-helix domain-containing protein [Aurantimonas aggregata]